ncbi:centrosomal protein of 68 kDa isoform X4 [Suricata suricatta]|uniref:centrosomal protein of 68 kDa isoform X4 n=1 Tax=Suricata suricatta TaxID=37032 RepID=UPI00115566B5|nr:centrosomal protein of 68 kDa isoform X4 [Suricata suricatta]
MALGEEKAKVEVSAKALSYGQWSCGEQEAETPGLASREREQPAEAAGGLASPSWGTEGPPAPACCDGAAPSPSGAYQPQANSTRREPVAGRSKPVLGCLLPPAGTATGNLLHSLESQMETRLSATEELPQTLTAPRATGLCSGHDANTEDDSSPVESPQVLDLSQQPHRSGFPFPTRWRSVVSQGAATPFSSHSVSASSPSSSLQGHQDKVEPQSCPIAKVSSSLELAVPQSAPSMVGPGPRLQWSPQLASSRVDALGQGRRRLSFQAEYWACVLPDSLPPSPDRHSPLWNPNKEYEDLLDYTYPLRPKPCLPKHLDSHMLADPVLQDSGIDLDSFSVSPASTLKSPANGSQNCPSAEASALPFSRPGEPSLIRWPSGAPQKPGSVGLAPCNQLTSTPRAPGSRDAPWGNKEPTLSVKDWLPMGKHPEVGSPQLRTWERGWPLPRTEREKRASQGVWHPACTESGWKPEEEVESDDEYLALPARLTQTFCRQLEELIRWLYNVADVTDHLIPSKSNLTGLKSSLQLYRQFKKDIDEHQFLTESVLQKGESLLQCLLDNTPVLKDVLGRISKQPSELESHADRLYDAILASLDMLAGCTLSPDHTPAAHGSTDVKGISLASSQAEM